MTGSPVVKPKEKQKSQKHQKRPKQEDTGQAADALDEGFHGWPRVFS
jgi:hypothetical protein